MPKPEIIDPQAQNPTHGFCPSCLQRSWQTQEVSSSPAQLRATVPRGPTKHRALKQGQVQIWSQNRPVTASSSASTKSMVSMVCSYGWFYGSYDLIPDMVSMLGEPFGFPEKVPTKFKRELLLRLAHSRLNAAIYLGREGEEGEDPKANRTVHIQVRLT